MDLVGHWQSTCCNAGIFFNRFCRIAWERKFPKVLGWWGIVAKHFVLNNPKHPKQVQKHHPKCVTKEKPSIIFKNRDPCTRNNGHVQQKVHTAQPMVLRVVVCKKLVGGSYAQKTHKRLRRTFQPNSALINAGLFMFWWFYIWLIISQLQFGWEPSIVFVVIERKELSRGSHQRGICWKILIQSVVPVDVLQLFRRWRDVR